MKKVLICFTVLLVGCTPFVVRPNFPDADAELMKPCEKLETIDKPDIKLSELTTSVVKNYKKYHDCSTVVDGWREWYTKQKKISQDLNK